MTRVSDDIYGANLFQLFVDDFGGVKAAAKYLHESSRTVERWLKTGHVPRSAVLALYWESRYGESQSYCDLVNELAIYYGQVCSLTDRVNEGNETIRDLLRMGYGSANQPLFKDFFDVKPLPPPTFSKKKTPPPAAARMQLSTTGQCDEGGSADSAALSELQGSTRPTEASASSVNSLAA